MGREDAVANGVLEHTMRQPSGRAWGLAGTGSLTSVVGCGCAIDEILMLSRGECEVERAGLSRNGQMCCTWGEIQSALISGSLLVQRAGGGTVGLRVCQTMFGEITTCAGSRADYGVARIVW